MTKIIPTVAAPWVHAFERASCAGLPHDRPEVALRGAGGLRLNDRLVNLTVSDHYGKAINLTSVQLLQAGDAKPYFCEWMPYQVGQWPRPWQVLPENATASVAVTTRRGRFRFAWRMRNQANDKSPTSTRSVENRNGPKGELRPSRSMPCRCPSGTPTTGTSQESFPASKKSGPD